MAKKKTQSRRVPRASEPRMFGDGKPSSAAMQPGQPGAAVAGRPVVAAPRIPVTVTQDYRYVLHDLRRLGILAVGVFGVLIALGLILR